MQDSESTTTTSTFRQIGLYIYIGLTWLRRTAIRQNS